MQRLHYWYVSKKQYINLHIIITEPLNIDMEETEKKSLTAYTPL